MMRGVGGTLSDGRSYPDVCRVRHMFLRVSRIYHYMDIFDKSQTQPGSGEGCSNITSGTPVAPVKKVALIKGIANAWGDVQKSSLRRGWRDKSATQD
jgi:hypothetical protein